MIKNISVFLILAFLLPFTLAAQFNIGGIETPPDPGVTLQFDTLSYQAGNKGTLKVLYSFPEGYHQTRDELNFRLDGVAAEGIIFGSTLYPEGLIEDGLENYYDSAELELEFYISETLSEGTYPLTIQARFQLCDEDGICYFPGSISLETKIDVLPAATAAGSASLLYFLLLAFIGGVLLNLMPCVLPLLSVKSLNLINQSQGDRKSILFNALNYTGGILFSFAVLSLVIILLKQSGQLLGWGFQFQNPWFLILLISVIFLFALSLFEVFILIPPSKGLNKASKLSSRKGYTGSFFTGVFAVFVATPCTAPFLGAAMGFAFSRTAPVITSIMAFTGLGFSLPFLILGFFPGFFKHLPKPGKWMDTFRELMAFLLMGTAVYLSSTLIRQIGGESFISVLWFIIILAAAAWFWGWNARRVRKKGIRVLLYLISAALIITAAVFLPGSALRKADTPSETGVELRENWQEFSPEAIRESVDQGETVFLAFSASWCTTCKINEKTVLYTDKTDTLFSESGVKLFKGDLTRSNEEAMKWIYSFGRAGVPLYILYKPGEEPLILPENLSYGILQSYLE